MATYRLASEAEDDLERIYNYGFEQWGEAAADRYHDAFFDRFEEIAERPNAYPAVDDIRKGYRGAAYAAWIAFIIASLMTASLK